MEDLMTYRMKDGKPAEVPDQLMTYTMKVRKGKYVAVSNHDNVDRIVGRNLSDAKKFGLRPVPNTRGRWIVGS